MKPGEHFSVVTDVSKSASVRECFQRVLEKYHRAPDIIVNCAGIFTYRLLLDMTEEDFDKVMDVNLKGTFLVTQVGYHAPGYVREGFIILIQKAVSLMKENGLPGSVINIASIVARTGDVGTAHYAASKAGMIGFTKTASNELGQFGIRVNAILPGMIKTQMTDGLTEEVSSTKTR